MQLNDGMLDESSELSEDENSTLLM